LNWGIWEIKENKEIWGIKEIRENDYRMTIPLYPIPLFPLYHF